jgi:hypothetical protein
MNTGAENLVPKVHPLHRVVEPEDPLELVATPVQGDPDFMLQCVVQEFAWMGWGVDELMRLFRSPLYPVLNLLLQHYGEQAVRQRVQALLGWSGVFRFQETVADDPAPENEDGPELIQLSLRRMNKQETPEAPPR